MSKPHTLDWVETRRACVRPCVGLLAVMAAVQALLALGVPLGATMWGGGHAVLPPPLRLASLTYAVVCVAQALVLLERAEIVTNCRPALWKRLTWAIPAVSGFAMTGHLLSPSPVEQALMGGACALVAVMSLFVAFSPDDADMIGNAQMTTPSEP
ncbi:MAG: hypothetical protein ACXU8U_11655 [Asticcacaulis sp.]